MLQEAKNGWKDKIVLKTDAEMRKVTLRHELPFLDPYSLDKKMVNRAKSDALKTQITREDEEMEEDEDEDEEEEMGNSDGGDSDWTRNVS